MNRVASFVVFFSVFFSIYLAMHYYVFVRMASLLDISRTPVFYSIMVLLALSFPVVSIIERFIDGPVCRLFYALASAWLGAVFMISCLLVIYEILNLIFNFHSPAAGIVVLVLTLILVVYGMLNAAFIQVNEIDVPVKGINKTVKLVQLSDIHVGTIHNSHFLSGVVSKVNSLDPDAVLITGDFVDGSGMIDSHSVAALKELKAKAFFATGNHEMYEGIDLVTHLLRDTGVEILRNSVMDHKGIQIIGIDNPGESVKDQNIALRNINIDKLKPSVLMFHPPLGFADAARAGISLQLSGHTHAGQVMPFNIFTRMFYKYTYGLYEKDGSYLYVSSGTGTWGPPMRIGSRSEIVLINLVEKQKKQNKK